MTRNKEIVIKSEINVVMGTCLNNIGTVNILFGIELSLEPSNSSQNGMSAQISSRGRVENITKKIVVYELVGKIILVGHYMAK